MSVDDKVNLINAAYDTHTAVKSLLSASANEVVSLRRLTVLTGCTRHAGGVTLHSVKSRTLHAAEPDEVDTQVERLSAFLNMRPKTLHNKARFPLPELTARVNGPS